MSKSKLVERKKTSKQKKLASCCWVATESNMNLKSNSNSNKVQTSSSGKLGIEKRFKEDTSKYETKEVSNKKESNLVRVAPDCNRSYCEDSFSEYSGSV